MIPPDEFNSFPKFLRFGTVYNKVLTKIGLKTEVNKKKEREIIDKMEKHAWCLGSFLAGRWKIRLPTSLSNFWIWIKIIASQSSELLFTVERIHKSGFIDFCAVLE